MKRNYVSFLRCLVGSHHYSSGTMPKELAEHQQGLGTLNVKDAVEYICNYTDSHRDVCCLYVVTAFMRRFPEDDIRFAYSPEPNPLIKKYNRAASKVVAVINGSVFDLVSMVEEQGTCRFDELVKKYCRIPIKAYIQKSLLPNEEFIILPKIQGHEDESFVKFFFSNDEAQHYTID